MRLARLTLPVTLALALLIAGCASVAGGTVWMVDTRSRSREICPREPGERTYTVTTPQMHEVIELQKEAARTGMSALEECARELELLGYRREGQAEYRRYVSPIYKWSISYPPGWTLDDKDPADVMIQ